jgi:hypothetical protein
VPDPVSSLSRDNLSTWLESEALRWGTASQRQRWDEGVLPEAELLDLAREQLFQVLERFRRWGKIRGTDVPHRPTCAMSFALAGSPGATEERSRAAITFSTISVTGLDHDEWLRSKAIIAVASEASNHDWCRRQGAIAVFQTDLRTHTAKCAECDASYAAPSILVSVYWAGRTLSREYAL